MSAIIGYLYTFDGHCVLLMPDEVETSWFEAHPEMYEPVVLMGKYEKLKAAREELAVQVEKMRGALLTFKKAEEKAVSYEPFDTDASYVALFAQACIERDESLALPDLSTGVVNKVRAEALRKAADDIDITGYVDYPTIFAYRMELRELAADMEAGK